MGTSIERKLKHLGLAGLRLVAPKPRAVPSLSDFKDIRSILVVRPDERIGNTVLITPLLIALKKQFPQARLDLLMSRRYWELSQFLPAVDHFIPFDKRRYARNPLALAGFIRRLRRAEYNLAFDCAGDQSSSFTHLAITALSGSRIRVGHDRGVGLHDVTVPAATQRRHAVQQHLDLLRAVVSCDPEPSPHLRPVPDSGFAARFLEEKKLDTTSPLIVVHPGARGPKRWPAAKFVEVARRLHAQGYAVVSVWGPADSDAASALLSAAGNTVHAAGILPFHDFISLVRRAHVFLASDSGPMHLAAAVPPQVGVVALFVTDTLPVYCPLGPNDVAIDARDPELPAKSVSEAVTRLIVHHQFTLPSSRVIATAGEERP